MRTVAQAVSRTSNEAFYERSDSVTDQICTVSGDLTHDRYKSPSGCNLVHVVDIKSCRQFSMAMN